MTLRDEILSRPDCAAALAERDCGALAAILSVGRVKTVDKPIGYGTVLEALGADAGAAFLDGLTALAATSSDARPGNGARGLKHDRANRAEPEA